MEQLVIFDENGFAINDGIVRVYSYNSETSEFVGFRDEFLVSGLGLPAHSCLDAPTIQPKEGFAICRINNSWQYIADYRGQEVYLKTTGQSDIVKQLGELPDDVTLKAPQTQFDIWDGENWVVDVEAQKLYFVQKAESKKRKLQERPELEITLLERASKLGIATDDELRLLEKWLYYSIDLYRIDTQMAPDITWPEIPR